MTYNEAEKFHWNPFDLTKVRTIDVCTCALSSNLSLSLHSLPPPPSLSFLDMATEGFPTYSCW